MGSFSSISNVDAIRNGTNDSIGYDLIIINLLTAENVVNNQNNSTDFSP